MTARFKRLKLFIVLLCVGTVSAAAAPLAWRLAGHDTVMPSKAELQVQEVVVDTGVDLGPVLALAPFGAEPVTAIEQDATPADTLDLQLLGVIVRDDPSRSLALIASPQGEANYRIGDAVFEAMTLKEVSAQSVLLDRDGEIITLTFEGEELSDDDSQRIPTGQDRLLALMTTGQGTTISAQNDANARATPVTTQDYITLWRARIKANPAEVLDAIGLVPTENGYIIAENHDSGVNRAGMKAGDIVRTLNGQAVGNIESDQALYDRVAESGVARVEIERNGRTIVMSFPLQ